MWAVETTDEFDEWFSSLGENEQDEIDFKIYLLRSMGPLLKRPHADTLSGSRYSNMKELRGKTSQAVLRVAFAFNPLKSAILLTGGNKQGVNEKRFYKQLIDRADKLYAEHLKEVDKRKIEKDRKKAQGD